MIHSSPIAACRGRVTMTTGVKLIHHPVVGDLDLPFESFPLAADPKQSLLT